MRSLLVLVAVLIPCASFGATIVPNSNLAWRPESGPEYQDEFGTNYMMKIEQDLLGDYTEIWFAFKQKSELEYSLDSTWVDLDQAADLYLVEPGDLFSRERIAADEFTPLFITDHWFPDIPPIIVGSDFYLGVATGLSAVRTVFGWAHFQVIPSPIPSDDDVLIMVENVMSYDSPGIIVGVIPEPATIALTSFAFITLVTLRRSTAMGRTPAAWRAARR